MTTNNALLRRFFQNRVASVSLVVFGVILVISAMAPFIANDRPIVMSYKNRLYFPALIDYLPYDFGWEGFVVDYLEKSDEISSKGWAIFPPIQHRPYTPNLNFTKLPAPPGSHSKILVTPENPNGHPIFHLLGTDSAGRDLLTRLIYGTRTSFVLAFSISIISLLLGVCVGAVMGYAGGGVDLVCGRILETIGYFPIIFLIIILVAFIDNPSMGLLVVIISMVGFPPFAFYMRGQVLQIRKQTYVEAAVALGQSTIGIIFKQILPNAIGPVLVLLPFNITGNITFLATIDFLGFGVQPPTASLGSILRSGFADVSGRWFLVLFSSVVLMLILLVVNFIGEGIREAMDPYATVSASKIRKMREIARFEET